MVGERKGKVCVTGGTGFLASWLIQRILQHGYSVNTTIRPSPGDTKRFNGNASIPFVHIDDVVEARIFLFEHPDANGRYICSALEIGAQKLYEFLSPRYPDLHLAHPAPPGESPKMKFPQLSSKKLLDIGFVFKYGLAEMYDDAIHCCKQRGLM